MLGRRAALLSPLLLPLAVRARAAAPIRVGVLRFGTASWELDVMRAHALGPDVTPVEFAASQATQVALQAGDVDVIVQDWLWVSRQRASGADFTFSGTSSALGAVIAPAGSPIADIPGLAGRRLGIAGSPLDKSWLILRAYATRRFALDLDAACEKSFAPPPLLAEQAAAGRLDAVLTYWPFAARAEAAGQRRILSMDDAVTALGVPRGLPFVGWVFSERWARDTPQLHAFLAASADARTILRESDDEWRRIAPLTAVHGHAEHAAVRDWYRGGIPSGTDARAAADLYDLLAGVGGRALVGDAPHLAPGTFWQGGSPAG